MQCEWLTQLPRNKIEKRLEKVDLVTGSSGYITKLIAEEFPDYSSRCHTLSTGFEMERFADVPITRSKTERPRSVLFVGELSPEKGIHTLLDAMSQVVTQRPDCRLDLVGPPTLPLGYNRRYQQGPGGDGAQSLLRWHDLR